MGFRRQEYRQQLKREHDCAKPPAALGEQPEMPHRDTDLVLRHFHEDPVMAMELVRQNASRASSEWYALELLGHGLSDLARLQDHEAGSLRKRLCDRESFEYSVLAQSCLDIAKHAPHLSTYMSSKISRALAMLGYRDEALFSLIGQQVQEKQKQLTQAQIANLLWSLNHLDIDDPKLTKALLRSALRISRIDELPIESRARIAWPLARLAPEKLRTLMSESMLREEDCDPEVYQLIYQTLVAAGMCSPTEAGFTGWAGARITDGQLGRESALQASVGGALRSFLYGTDHEIREEQSIGGVLVDFVVHLRGSGRLIAIEADGYHYHFSSGPDGGRRFGRDELQRKIVEEHGLEVVHITSQEWSEIPHEDLLADKLRLSHGK